MLPDASTGLSPGTLVAKLSRCKEGMAHFLPSRHRVLWRIRASRYRVVKELANYPGAVKFIGVSGAIRVCQAVLSCLGSRCKCKKCDKQLTFIVRVIRSFFISFNRAEILWNRSCYYNKTKLSPEFNASE